MGEWKTYTLQQLADPAKHAMATGPFGSAISSRHFTNRGVPVLRGSNLSVDVGHRLIEDDLVFLDESKAKEFVRSQVTQGDLVFTCWGTIGQLGIIDDMARYDRYVVSNKQMKMTPDRSKVNPLFLYYKLSTPQSLWAVQNMAIGSSVPGFNLTQLKSIEVDIPSIEEQQAIVAVLGALDDKIALNERIASGADELRRNLFDQYIAEASTAIRSVPLSSTADFINGRAFTKEATGTGRMVIRIAEINSGPSGSTVYNDIDVPDQHLARPGDVLFAWSGSLTVARWFRPEAIINQHIFKVVPKSGIPTWLAFELTRSKLDEFKGIAADKATTMGHIQRRHLDEPVSMPAVEDLPRLDAELGPLWARALVAEQENLALAQLRDTLLPKLMSGELRVRDAEKMVEDAT